MPIRATHILNTCLALGIAAASPSRAQTAAPAPLIFGLVTDKTTGQPVPEARVSIVGYEGASSTSAEGKFALRGARDSAVELHVQRIGYREVHRPVILGDSVRVRVDIALEPVPIELGAVVIKADASATAKLLENTGFNCRTSPSMRSPVTSGTRTTPKRRPRG
ncbi:MAG: carboxypeptidase-like regulatory domain-containing protein [Gemmatimonadota bacterium]|nr:carboxypeptidase-like regulatory domain-containing protein [Gemmatimonadota bacterium]